MQMQMTSNLIKDLKVHMKGTQEKAGYSLLRLAKTGRMTASRKDKDIVDRFVYKAYKPILDRKHVTKDDFLSHSAQAAAYREQYAIFIRNMLGAHHTEILDANDKLDVIATTNALLASNNDWIALQDSLQQNNEEPEVKRKIQTQVPYTTYVVLSEEDRKRLIRIARDKNRTADKAVFQALESYITQQEGVYQGDYLDNPELRDKYRGVYQELKAELEKEETQGKMSFETGDEAIKRISNAAGFMISTRNMTKGQVDLPEVPSLIALSHLTPIELSQLEQSYLDGLSRKVTQDYDTAQKRRQDEIDSLNKIFDDHHKAMNEMFADFNAHQAERAMENVRWYNEMMRQEETKPSTDGVKKNK